MPATNNEKYIAEAWIENGEEEEFKKSFLESLLQQVEGEGNGFDADMLDGLHLQDIKDYMEGQYGNRLKEFQIGGVHISNTNIEDHNNYLTLGFDGVSLYPLNPDGSPQDGYPTLLPWVEGYTSPQWGNSVPNVLNAFEELYGIVQDKVNQDDFDEILEDVDEVSSVIADLKDNSNLIYDESTFVGLNADSINGIRIYIMTQAEYDEKAQTNPDLINDIHNLFIIKSNETVIDDLLKAHQPNTATISSYYEFRVSSENPDDLNTPLAEKYLQYKHADLNKWHLMCPVSNLTDADTIKNAVFEVIEESSNYTINATAFSNAFKRFQIIDESSDYPVANYIRDHSARSAYSNLFKLNPSDNDILPLVNASGNPSSENGQPRYINLDNFGRAIIQEAGISTINNNISTLQTTVGDLTNPSTGTIRTIQTDISSNQANIAELERKYNSLKASLENITSITTKLFTYEYVKRTGTEITQGNWVTTGTDASRVEFFRYGYTVFVSGRIKSKVKIGKGKQRHITMIPSTMAPGHQFKAVWIPLSNPATYGYVYSAQNNGRPALKIKPYSADLPKDKIITFSGAYLLKDFIQEKDSETLQQIIAQLDAEDTPDDD